MNETIPISFFDRRLKPLGVTDANNGIEIFDADAEFPKPSKYPIPIFSEDAAGNIQIAYWTIDGTLLQFFHSGTGKMSHVNGSFRPYVVKRLKEPKGNDKYQMPAGHGTHPWFHPSLVTKFNDKTRIETLYLTEGVFKGWAGCESGVDVVALSSITHYADQEKKLHSDIARLIEVCEVQNVVVLWDGDCLNISESDLQSRLPITRRPVGFYSAAKKIAELVGKIKFEKTRHHPCVYFMHPKTATITNHPKGLDDVLLEPELQKAQADILKDLRSFTDGRWFGCCNITESAQELYQMMGLNDIQIFYDRHKRQIKRNEFYFFKDKYKYNDTREELELLMPGWAQTLRWIGDDFFNLQIVPGAKHDRRVLKPIQIGTLKNLYGSEFLKYMKNAHHAAFVNIPNHFDYEEVIEREGKKYYNRYFPFKHVPEEGKFPKTMMYLKHIFGEHEVTNSKNGKKYSNLELGLDYVQHLLMNPTQILPVLILYSQENNTGKSTLGLWLHRLFSDNAVFLSNADLLSEFNDTYADKLLAICEETSMERKKDTERIKALSTQHMIMVNTKSVQQASIDFFCKFQFYSNNRRMIYVTKHDERFWILKIPVVKSDNPRLLDEMTTEIPAFIHFLKSRAFATPNESRMWFHSSMLKTKMLEETVRVNEPADATNIREEIRDMFLQDPATQHIEMTMLAITEEFFTKTTKTAWIQEILSDYLNVELEKDAQGKTAQVRRGKYTIYRVAENKFGNDATFEVRAVTKSTRGRHYIFRRENFVHADEASFMETEETTETEASYNGAIQNGAAVTPLSKKPVGQSVVQHLTNDDKLKQLRDRQRAVKQSIREQSKKKPLPTNEIKLLNGELRNLEKDIQFLEKKTEKDIEFLEKKKEKALYPVEWDE